MPGRICALLSPLTRLANISSVHAGQSKPPPGIPSKHGMVAFTLFNRDGLWCRASMFSITKGYTTAII